jgi:PLD-like domain
MSDPEAPRLLGQLLTRAEAKGIADRLIDGDTLTTALKIVAVGKRPEVRQLVERIVQDCKGNPQQIVPVLRAIEGARRLPAALSPLWTMPGHLAQSGPLTTSVIRLIDSARHAITCSTYNFQRSSVLWKALRQAARRDEVAICIYLDARAADNNGQHSSPSTTEVAAHLAPSEVWRTKEFDGVYVRNHAKFLAVDHRILLVTSANFSWSAENNNVEFGVLIDNPSLAEAVESELWEAQGVLYERVS